MRARSRIPLKRATLRHDAVAGLVLGVQSVPDGLATGLLAGVNPLAGLYAYMVGTFTGAFVTSSSFMAIQGTGAMAMIVLDVPEVHGGGDPERAVFTLAILTGVVMLAAGLLKLGALLRFVSNAVMVGFINAVGVNIVLGQLANFTGYDAQGPNRIVRAVDTLLSPGQLDPATLAVGVATIALIVLLERTRIGALGLVIAVVATSAGAFALGSEVATLNDLGVVASSLPRPEAPLLALVPSLVIPALSLAFVGLVQGASISANYPEPGRHLPGRLARLRRPGGGEHRRRDLPGDAGRRVCVGVGPEQGGRRSLPPVARDRRPGDGGRGRRLRPGGRLRRHARPRRPADADRLPHHQAGRPAVRVEDGIVQKVVLVVTFVLTMIVPLQYAVLVGVGVSVILFVVRQSNQVTIRRWQLDGDGHVVETDPPAELPAGEVVVLQPYGSLFFAAAPVFEALLPVVTEASRRSVVVLRLRGRSELGTTLMDVLHRYGQGLAAVGSKLVVVSTNERIEEQLAVTGIADLLGPENVYRGDHRVGATVRRAHADAQAWVEAGRG